MNRIAYFIIFIGTNNTGKTTQLKRFLKLNKRNLVLKPNPFDEAWADFEEIDVFEILDRETDGIFDDYDRLFQNNSDRNMKLQTRVLDAITKEYRAMTGTKTIFIAHPEIYKRIVHVTKGFTDGGLVHDDFKSYIPSNNIPKVVQSLFGDRRHKMLDLFFACHGPDQVPPKFFNYGPTCYIFKTTGNWQRLREGFEDKAAFDRLIEVKNYINAVADRPDKDGQVRSGTPNRFYYREYKFEF